MTDTDCSKPQYEASVKLCAAVKKYKCLHDQNSYLKNVGPKCEEAWEMVADECNESVEYCKSRWRSLRRCFFDGLKRRGNKYYLHDHLDFLLGTGYKKSKRSSTGLYTEDANSNLSDSLQKNDGNSVNVKERPVKTIKIPEDDDIKSFSSQTTSADESNENLPQAAGVFIINEFEDDGTYLPDKDFEEDKRSSFSRSCKRALDPNLINDLDDEESQPKRPRRSDKSNNKHYTVRADKTKIITQKVESVKDKSKFKINSTEPQLGVDIGIQCGSNCTDLDDIFMQSINTQLQEMNGRQKMNFKRKIYQALLEVFDDANDFPNSNEPFSSPAKQPPSVVTTTVGELRLMRELVSLVQAAKITPEIMNATEKIKSSTPVPNKIPLKMPTPVGENLSKSTRSPLSISPTPDDDDLQFFVDSDDEEEIPLPRSWDEIKAKTAETAKTITQENNVGLPRRILQKVVRVSGSNGGTIVARDGDKKRIYRIIPKHVYPSGSNATLNKNETNINRIVVSKNPQDPRKESNVGTFYVPNVKNSQGNSSAANITIRPFNSKHSNSSQPVIVSSSSGQHSSSNTNHNSTNGQTIFKNIHPANRILSSSTGYFKMVPSAKSIAPPLTQKPSSQPTSTAPGNPSKVMTTKASGSPMLPPSSNVTAKRIQTVRAEPPILQRRFSICSSVPADKQHTPPNKQTTSASNNASKSVVSSSNSKAQGNISQIQISQPVSLNSKASNAPTTVTTQTNPSTNSPKPPTSPHATKSEDSLVSKNTKHPAKPIEMSKESVTSNQFVGPAKDKGGENTLQREIPILETAGTVEADHLDPLFVKPPHVKSEPIDDDE